jgi:3'-5' exonuclease
MARFLLDPLLQQRLPWKLQQVYKLLGATDRMDDCPSLDQYLATIQARNPAQFAVDVLEMLQFISQAREDTASLMIISSAIKLLERNSVPIPSQPPRMEPVIQKASTSGWDKAESQAVPLANEPVCKSDWVSQDGVGSSKWQTNSFKAPIFQGSTVIKHTSESKNNPTESQQMPVAVRKDKPIQENDKPKHTSDSQLEMLNRFKHVAQDRKLDWSSDEAEEDEVEEEDENDSEGPQPAKKPLSSDGSEEDSDVDPDEMYNNLKHLEGELMDACPETKFNDSYFDDAKHPKNGIAKARIYTFGQEEVQDDGMEGVPQLVKKKKQKKASKPNKTHKPIIPAVKMMKSNLNPRDREKVKRNLDKFKSVDYQTALHLGAEIDKITHELVPDCLAKQIKKEHGRSSKQRKADPNPAPLPEAYRPNYHQSGPHNKKKVANTINAVPSKPAKRGKRRPDPQMDSSSDDMQDHVPTSDNAPKGKQPGFTWKPEGDQDDAWHESDQDNEERMMQAKPAAKKRKNESPQAKKQRLAAEAAQKAGLGAMYGLPKGPDSDYPNLAWMHQTPTQNQEKPIVSVQPEAEADLMQELQAALIGPDSEHKQVPYIKIADLRQDYTYTYISKSGDDFTAAMDYLDTQKLVGFDTEFITNDRMLIATYIQFSTLEKGFVINLQHSQFETEFRQRLASFFTNKAIKKIGFSIKNDIAAIKRVFLNDIELEGFESIEQHLFLNCDSLSLGLSHICKRYYGKPLNKQLQTSVADNKDLTSDSEIVYTVMDALVPICLYEDFKEIVEYKCMGGSYLEDDIQENDFEFLVDPSCKGLIQKLARGEYSVLELDKELNHQQIIEAASKTATKVFITSDKYLILKGEKIRNKMGFSTSKKFDEGKQST